VPENLLDEVQTAISARLASTKMGDPAQEGVRMGALATKLQVERVRANVDLLAQSQDIVFGNPDAFELVGADAKAGAFFPPILFRNENPLQNTACHDIEAFGPVATIMPYKDLDQAIRFDPENAKYYLERANVKLKMDNLDGAIADYGLTISFSKQNIDAHFLRAHAYVLRMDYPLAIQDYSAVINYDQNNSEALYNRAVLLFEMGLTEAACEDWRVCVQLGKPEAIKWVQQYCKK
jgi:tetratricopeptide (TPR) repeat protein